jgi:hypothetical protein
MREFQNGNRFSADQQAAALGDFFKLMGEKDLAMGSCAMGGRSDAQNTGSSAP